MYGFSGYGTSAYGSERQSQIAGPLVKLAVRIVQNAYNVAAKLTLQFRPVAVLRRDPSPMALPLRFRSLTLSNPETNQRTLEL
jgi:hypothetical protein